MTIKIKLAVWFAIITTSIYGQQENPTKQFWTQLQTHCNKA